MDVPCDMLLYPELLNNDQLKYVIQQRHLRIPNIQNLPRDELLQVFHQYCVPHGQRKYRDSGRGKILNRTRHMSPDDEPPSNTMNNNQRKRSFTCTDRVKPPPDLLTGHMKRIKLDNKSTSMNNVNINKRKMSIDAVSPAADNPPPPKKDRKPITWP